MQSAKPRTPEASDTHNCEFSSATTRRLPALLGGGARGHAEVFGDLALGGRRPGPDLRRDKREDGLLAIGGWAFHSNWAAMLGALEPRARQLSPRRWLVEIPIHGKPAFRRPCQAPTTA